MRKKQNDKPFFVFFFQKFKTHFFPTSKNQIFFDLNDVVKSIDTQKEKPFFYSFPIIPFFRKLQHMCICFIINLQNKNGNEGVPSCVLTQGIFAKGYGPI